MDDDYMQMMLAWQGQETIGVAPPAGRRAEVSRPSETPAEEDPVEEAVVQAHRRATARLRAALLARIQVQTPAFFERLIIDVLLAMGYGSRRRDLARHLGRSGDGGVDGVIALDELALDAIYVQAKRLKPGTLVPVSAVRDFVGSLEAARASKGVFVTTGYFSPAGREVVKTVSRRVVLINGDDLTGLMIRLNIGVTVKQSYQFKQLEPGYFAGGGAGPIR